MLHILCTGVIGHGLPQDGSSRRVSVLRTLRDFVLGQNFLPQGESSPCAETLSLGYFLWQRACPRPFRPVELLS